MELTAEKRKALIRLNLAAAESLRDRILAQYPQADVRIRLNGGLCSFYSEKGGLIIGYETRK